MQRRAPSLSLMAARAQRGHMASGFIQDIATFPVLYFSDEDDICIFKFPPLNSAIAVYRVSPEEASLEADLAEKRPHRGGSRDE
eukprot:1176770-Prorocentrum_minimum.AAC.2